MIYYIFCAFILLSVHPIIKSASRSKNAYVTTFVSAADRFTSTGDAMLIRIDSSPNLSLSKCAHDKDKKIKSYKPARFLTLVKKNKIGKEQSMPSYTPILQTSEPTLPSTKTALVQERILDLYVSALTFYIEGGNTRHPATSMYVRMQMAHVLDQLENLFAPIDLFASTTMYEPGFKELLIKSKNIIAEPIMPSLIVHDINKKHVALKKALQSNMNNMQTQRLCNTLCAQMKTLLYIHTNHRAEPHQQIIIHAYAHQTWGLIQQLPSCEKKTRTIEELYYAWQNIHTKQHNTQILFNEFENQIKTKSKLFKNPLVTQNHFFLNQLIREQTQTLSHLLCLNQAHEHNKFQQYWIHRAANRIIELCVASSFDTNKEFAQSLHCWKQLQQPTAATILQHISLQQSTLPQKAPSHKDTVLHQEQTRSCCFKMLSILIDLYTQRSICPASLTNFIDSLCIIKKTIRTALNLKSAQLTEEENSLIAQARRIINTDTETYKLIHYIYEAEKLIRIKSKKPLIDDDTGIRKLYDFTRADRMYNMILCLYEYGQAFSPQELIWLKEFAQFLKLALPSIILAKAELNEECEQFQHFLQRLPERIASQAVSSSSS